MLNIFKSFFLIIFLIIENVSATGLDAETGVLEWSCQTSSGRSFKRSPVNVKFNGKDFYGEYEFFSKRLKKNFIQTFKGNVQSPRNN